MLHTYVLSGGDQFINLVAFAAFLASDRRGFGRRRRAWVWAARGQAFAALFCATLPNGILQASGAKNDWLLALWLVCLVYFAARRDALFSGLARGPGAGHQGHRLPVRAAAAGGGPAMAGGTPPRSVAAHGGVCLAGGMLLINAPAIRPQLPPERLASWATTPPTATAFSAGATSSLGGNPPFRTLLRNTSEQLGARSPRWNQAVYDAVLRIHRALGIDPQDPDTTWRWAAYEPPVNANHEANANNRWHLLLLAGALVLAAASGPRRWPLYGAALLAGFPAVLFLSEVAALPRAPGVAAVRAGRAAGRLRAGDAAAPLAGRGSGRFSGEQRAALRSSRTGRAASTARTISLSPRATTTISRTWAQWNNRASYFEAADLTARSGCALVGIDISRTSSNIRSRPCSGAQPRRTHSSTPAWPTPRRATTPRRPAAALRRALPGLRRKPGKDGAVRAHWRAGGHRPLSAFPASRPGAAQPVARPIGTVP